MNMSRPIRFSLLVVIVVMIGTAGKVTMDKVAAEKLADARNMARGKVFADIQEVDRLSKVVVPTRQEMYVNGPIHAGDSFAGMVGSNGFAGGPFQIRTVPDEEAGYKLAVARKVAADKLAADEATADKLAKQSVRWQDAFGAHE